MVWPLPLTAFEEYMLADDRPQWPMTFFLRLELRGRYDASLLSTALSSALARHPLLASLLEDGGGRLRWALGKAAPPQIACCDSDCEIDFPDGPQIDLRNHCGVRVWVRGVAADQWALWFQFHHACCDGLGAMQFVNDVLAEYGAARNDSSCKRACHVLEPDRLLHRKSFGLTPLRRLLRLPQEFLGLLGAVEFFSHRPPSLASASGADSVENNPQPATFPRWINHRFGPEQTDRLRQAARAEGVTLNDLLLTSLFWAIDDWFDVHCPAARQRFSRVMVPMNLRGVADANMPAANIVSMVNVDRRPIRYASRRRLLKSISLEMAIIKRCRLGLTMHHFLRAMRWIGKMSWLLPADRCLSTCVLSNLGEVTTPADSANGEHSSPASRLELISLDFLPPIRPWTAAAFGISTYRGCTTITLHHDATLPPGSERDLLDKFVARLEECCAGGVASVGVQPSGCRSQAKA